MQHFRDIFVFFQPLFVGEMKRNRICPVKGKELGCNMQEMGKPAVIASITYSRFIINSLHLCHQNRCIVGEKHQPLCCHVEMSELLRQKTLFFVVGFCSAMGFYNQLHVDTFSTAVFCMKGLTCHQMISFVKYL